MARTFPRIVCSDDFQYGHGIRGDVPRTPNPIRVVRLNLTVPRASSQYWHRVQSAKLRQCGSDSHLALQILQDGLGNSMTNVLTLVRSMTIGNNGSDSPLEY